MALNLFKRVDSVKGLFAVESISLIYNALTTIMVLILFPRMDHPVIMLLERAGIVATTFALIYLYRKYPCKLTAFIRMAVQMAFLAYWYPDTFEFNRLFPNLDNFFASSEQFLFRCQPSLQRDYQVNVAGPSTMAALLNSLQMGFKTLAIQKRSGEVWQLLGAVKTEFDKFGQGLSKMQQRLRQTDEELDNLIGVRSRAISRKLRSVQSLDEAAAATLLELDAPLRPLSGGQLPLSGSQWQDGEL